MAECSAAGRPEPASAPQHDAPIAEGLGDVDAAHRLRALEVGQGPGHAQHPVDTIGGPAAASDNANMAFDSEVKSCVAEVGEHANYNDAIRVRHAVVKIKNTLIGYVLTIDTSVFTNSDEIAVRKYASYCVAKGDDKPVKFRIDEISG